MNKKLPLMVAVAALVTVSSVVAVVDRPAVTPPAEATITEPDRVAQLSPEQVAVQKAAVIAAAGRGVMRHVDAAYRLVGEGEMDQAGKLLQVAQRILGRINLAVKEEGTDPDAAPAADLVIPLYARLGLMEEADPSPETRQGLNDLAPLVASGDHDAVVERLKGFDIAMTYSYVEMPLKKVTEEVDAAVDALEKGDQAGAEAFLKAAEDANISATVSIGVDAEAAPEKASL